MYHFNDFIVSYAKTRLQMYKRYLRIFLFDKKSKLLHKIKLINITLLVDAKKIFYGV